MFVDLGLLCSAALSLATPHNSQRISHPGLFQANILQQQIPTVEPIPPSLPQLGIPQIGMSGPYVPAYGLNYSAYLPTSQKVRAAFGSQWSAFGPGFGPTFAPYGARAKNIQPDFGILQSKQDPKAGENFALIFFVGAGQRRALRKSTDLQVDENGIPTRINVRSNVPYFGWSANFMFSSIEQGPANDRDISLGFSGSVIVGYTISKNALVEARYRQTSTQNGFDFSGTELRFGIRF